MCYLKKTTKHTEEPTYLHVTFLLSAIGHDTWNKTELSLLQPKARLHSWPVEL